ncbi:MAG: hypothetical protein ABC596_06940 [Candidatus Methanosuratincola petrocarbonis]
MTDSKVTIKVSEETYRKLVKAMSAEQLKTGKRLTYDEFLSALCDLYFEKEGGE